MERAVLLAVLRAIKYKKMWVLSRQGIVLDCSENWLDFFELTRNEFIHRDITSDPLDWIIKGREKAGRHLTTYEMEIAGSITKMPKKLIVVPHIYKNYRFTVFEPIPMPVFDFDTQCNILETAI